MKIALLIIQKDLETICGFPPIISCPLPLYSEGFFKTDEQTYKVIQANYGGITPFDREKIFIA